MNLVPIVLASLCTVAGAIGTLGLWVLSIAMAPNSSPAQEAQLKLMFVGTPIVGVAIVASACVLMAFNQPIWAAIVGAFPAVVLLGLIAYGSAR